VTVTTSISVGAVSIEDVPGAVVGQAQVVRVRPVRMITDARGLPSGLRTLVRRASAGIRTTAIRSVAIRSVGIRAVSIRSVGIRAVSIRSIGV
jgi:hypothetical protein